MLDIRAELSRSVTVKQINRTSTNFITIHYNGPSVSGYKDDVKLLKMDADYHVRTRGWDGLAYHFAVGRDGIIYRTRDYDARLNHSGVPKGNSESLAVFVVCGEGDVPPPIQLNALESLLVELKIRTRYVLGHKEWPRATACPGALLTRWLNSYRSKSSGGLFEGKVKFVSNVRDEPNVTSHLVRKLSPGTPIKGKIVLANPVQGDSMWVQLEGSTDYVHASGIGV